MASSNGDALCFTAISVGYNFSKKLYFPLAVGGRSTPLRLGNQSNQSLPACVCSANGKSIILLNSNPRGGNQHHLFHLWPNAADAGWELDGWKVVHNLVKRMKRSLAVEAGMLRLGGFLARVVK